MPQNIKSATRKDVARLAGVSETIVSYVVNNNRYVADDKRKRVLDAIQRLNYKPNNIARALKGKRSNHILFIADNISNEHFGKIVEEMDRISYDKGYLISLLADRSDQEFVAQVNSRLVDGIVISSASFEEKYVLQLIDSGVPVVLLMNRDYALVGDRASKIYTGIQQGVKECVKLLEQKGRRNIIYIDRISAHGHFSTMDDLRYNGFCAQMHESGLPITEDTIITGYTSEDDLYRGLRKKIEQGMKVDGVVGRNDNLACVAMSALIDCGFKIPADASVIGFDNSRMSSHVKPTLSSMEIDRPAIARTIVSMLDDMISGNGPSTQKFETKFIEREST